MNVSALRMVEDRAYGWYHTMATTAGLSLNPGNATRPPTDRLVLNRAYPGTTNGLSKFPCLLSACTKPRGGSTNVFWIRFGSCLRLVVDGAGIFVTQDGLLGSVVSG